VRARCAFLLGELKHAAAAPQLEALLKDSEPSVRLRAATALGDFKDPQLIPVLARAYAGETERWTRHLLVRGLREANGPKAVMAAVRSAPEAVQPDLLHALRDQYDPAVTELLLATAGDTAATVPLRAKAVEFLGLIARKEARRWTWGDRPTIQPAARTEDWSETEKIVASLRAAVRDEAASVRSAALAALQKINDTTVVDTLLKDLEAGRAKLDASTAQILVGSAGAEKAAPLLGRFLNDTAADTSVRLEIARAFGLWSAPESLPPLRAAAADPAAPAALRAAALDGLGRRKDAAALDTARAVLKDAPPEAQRAAARALGALGNKAAEPALLAALGSSDRALKSQALLALWRLNTDSATAAVLRALVALPASEDALQMEILDGLSSSQKPRLEPALLVWAEFGTPSKGAERELAERFEKWAKSDFGLATGSLEKRAAGLKKLAEHRARAYPKFAVPENLKPAAAAPAEDDEARLARLTKAAATATGDAARGAAVFRNTQAANCIACHIVGKEGRRVGPELSEVASKYARAQLVESVLYPSKQLLDGYEQSVLVLKSGGRVGGIVMNETPEKLDVAMSDGSTVTVPLGEISKRQKSKNSLMPDGLANPLSDQEFFDLIVYLESLKK
jgi:putative heme-binding domain-containing protein